MALRGVKPSALSLGSLTSLLADLGSPGPPRVPCPPPAGAQPTRASRRAETLQPAGGPLLSTVAFPSSVSPTPMRRTPCTSYPLACFLLLEPKIVFTRKRNSSVSYDRSIMDRSLKEIKPLCIIYVGIFDIL